MKLKNIILFGTVALAMTACDDLFDPALENNKDLSEAKDPLFARGLIDNAFLLLPYTADGNSQSDVATDDAVSNDIDNNYMKMATGNWTAQSNPVEQWGPRYHAIQYCNLFLEIADQVEWAYSGDAAEAANKMYNDLYVGNAYALRGLQLFFLLRAHCGMVDGKLMGVPILLTSEDPYSDFNHTRNTFEECIDQIMSDFDEALKYLPAEYKDVGANDVPSKYTSMGGTDAEYNRAFGPHQKGKIDGNTIAAFKAQVANFAASPAYQSANSMSWEQAAKYAADYLKIRGGLGGMDPTGWKWFIDKSYINNYQYTDPDRAEVAWRGNVGDGRSLEESNFPPSLYGNGRVNPTQNLVDAFPTVSGYPIDQAPDYDPANPYENRDPRLRTYILVNNDPMGVNNTPINTTSTSPTLDGLNKENGRSTKTGYYLRKHLRDDVNLEGGGTNQKHFGVRIRTTEIFLDYAEAANEAQGPMVKVGGADYSAYDVIKAIRQRAGVGGTNDPYLEECAQNKDKMRELIRNERRLELCFENHRFWDLRRWQANLNETAKGVNITTDVNDGSLIYRPFDVEVRDYKEYMYYGPIPYSEILKFSNLQQNDGWR